MSRRPVGRRRRERSEVSQCVKWVVFGFNVVFWMVGGLLLGVGLWAWYEKDVFNNLGQLTSAGAYLDPALMFICVGLLSFGIGFCGCIGALRENTALLLVYIVVIALLLLLELATGVVLFVFKDQIRDQIKFSLLDSIRRYQDDLDRKNFIDWVQEDWLRCCGISDFRDWNENAYFNCTPGARGVQACGVPFSCCRRRSDTVYRNRQCGYKSRSPTAPDRLVGGASDRVETRGCLPAGEEWLKSNLVPVAAVAVGVALVQIMGVCCGHNLRADVLAQRAKFLRSEREARASDYRPVPASYRYSARVRPPPATRRGSRPRPSAPPPLQIGPEPTVPAAVPDQPQISAQQPLVQQPLVQQPLVQQPPFPQYHRRLTADVPVLPERALPRQPPAHPPPPYRRAP